MVGPEEAAEVSPHGDYGSAQQCRRVRIDAIELARRRRMQRAALYGAVTLVSISVVLVLVAHFLRDTRGEDASVVGLQKLYGGNIFLQNSPATIQSAIVEQQQVGVPADTLQPSPGFQDARPAPPPGFVMSYRARLAGKAPTALMVPQPPIRLAGAPYVSSYVQTMPYSQSIATTFADQPVSAVRQAVAMAQTPAWASPSAAGSGSNSAQYPISYFSGAPVWAERQGAAYVDQPMPRPGMTWTRTPTPLNPFAGVPLPSSSTVVSAPAVLTYNPYRQAQLPAANSVQKFLVSRQPRFSSQVAGAGPQGETGAPSGFAGQAAAQYGAAYGAAFASTYKVLMAQGRATAVKQQALQRLERKANTEAEQDAQEHAALLPKPLSTVQTQVRIALPQPGWRMPPLARTGTAIVEQSLMTPGEVEQQQQQAATSYNGPSIDIMSATGGPTVRLNSEEQSAFRVNAHGQLTDTQNQGLGEQQVAAPAAPLPMEGVAVDAGLQDGESQDPLGVAEGAVAMAAEVAPNGRISSLAELV